MKTLFIPLLLTLIAYLMFWPVPIEPVSWSAPDTLGYVGKHATNNKLSNLQTIDLGKETGPEHVAFDNNGKLYAAMSSGNILRMNPDGTAQEIFARTGGRVLGFDFDIDNNLLAADAMRGILSISPDGTIAVLVDNVNNDSIGFPNSITVARNGKVYFTDSSTRFTPSVWGGTFEASTLDIVEQSATGRVLEYDPEQNTTRIIVKGLSFANGIALSQDERSFFVNETGRYRVWKILITEGHLNLNDASPLAEIIFDNLPGYPDNLMRGLDGRIWLGFAKPRSAVIDFMSDKPFLRKMVLRFPRFLWPIPEAYGHVVAFNETGQIVADLQDPAGSYPETTAVTETQNRLYIQSLHASSLGWLSRDAVQMQYFPTPNTNTTHLK